MPTDIKTGNYIAAFTFYAPVKTVSTKIHFTRIVNGLNGLNANAKLQFSSGEQTIRRGMCLRMICNGERSEIKMKPCLHTVIDEWCVSKFGI